MEITLMLVQPKEIYGDCQYVLYVICGIRTIIIA